MAVAGTLARAPGPCPSRAPARYRLPALAHSWLGLAVAGVLVAHSWS